MTRPHVRHMDREAGDTPPWLHPVYCLAVAGAVALAWLLGGGVDLVAGLGR